MSAPVHQHSCPKCGANENRVIYSATCSRRDCDHRYCGDNLTVTCNVCGYRHVRRPLDHGRSS